MKQAAYWVPTALVGLVFLFGGVMDLVHNPDMDAQMIHLGYAPYVATLLGIWKLLGAMAVLGPGLPRVKEWAYAGMVFDLTGAAFSHASSGDPVSKILTPLVVLLFVVASYTQRPASRKLA